MKKRRGRVLVLSKSWHPINVVSTKKALVKTCSERANIIDLETGRVCDMDTWVDIWAGEERSDAINGVKIASRSENGRVVVAPSVIVCSEYSGIGITPKKGKAKFCRSNLLRRDKCRCCYCGNKFKAKELTMDHVIPKSKGGQTNWTNIVTACDACNAKKKDRTPEKAGMRLLTHPYTPNQEDVVAGPLERLYRLVGRRIPKEWEQFVGEAYWDVQLV